ncbi:MAG: hypothetical protein CW338_01065 [Clostridiales bacterium]|nr:hypothetical protein [Clostridiales bacterium]
MKKVVIIILCAVLCISCLMQSGLAETVTRADICNELEKVLAVIGNDDALAMTCVYYDEDSDTYYGYLSADLLVTAYYAYQYDEEEYEQIIHMLNLPYQCMVAFCKYYGVHSNFVIKYTTNFFTSSLFLYVITKQDISSDTPAAVFTDIFQYAAVYGADQDVLRDSEFGLDISVFPAHPVRNANDVLVINGVR